MSEKSMLERVQSVRNNEQTQLLNCLVQQNEDLLQQNAMLIECLQKEVEFTQETNRRLENIDKRQSKQDRINMPSILVATIAGYCAIHVYYLGEDHLRQTLISVFDYAVRFFESFGSIV